MKIRAGYEISYECAQPTPMILTLSVHPSRRADLLTPDRLSLHPKVPVREYSDGFGNICHVIRAPAGLMTVTSDFIIEDNGRPDPFAPPAAQHALDALPVETLVYLLGSRYCETDLLSDFAWSKFGSVPRGGALVQAICDFVHDHIEFDYAHASATRSAYQAFQEGRGFAATSPISRLRSAAA
jgi:transglutaminase-like putative cysteine protease